MKTLTTVLSALLCLAAEGQVVTYKGRIAVMDTGGGFATRIVRNVWLLWNPADTTLMAIVADPAQKIILSGPAA